MEAPVRTRRMLCAVMMAALGLTTMACTTDGGIQVPNFDDLFDTSGGSDTDTPPPDGEPGDDQGTPDTATPPTSASPNEQENRIRPIGSSGRGSVRSISDILIAFPPFRINSPEISPWEGLTVKYYITSHRTIPCG